LGKRGKVNIGRHEEIQRQIREERRREDNRRHREK
jgi:hypothetical protein